MSKEEVQAKAGNQVKNEVKAKKAEVKDKSAAHMKQYFRKVDAKVKGSVTFSK